jgi:hypothetical protein
VGGIVGLVRNGATILGCENKAAIIISPSGTPAGASSDADGIGGIVGVLTSGGKIIACKNSAPIIGATGNTGGIKSDGVGGICGSADAGTIITACYNTANISGHNYTGGILGKNHLGAIITACYNGGNVTIAIQEALPEHKSGSIMGTNFGDDISYLTSCFRGGYSPTDIQALPGIPYGAYWETGNVSVYWVQPITQPPKLYWED